MTEAVLPNDQWNRYYIQWHMNNQRLQQPIASTVASQSLEITGPALPQQIQDQRIGQQQSQVSIFLFLFANSDFKSTFKVRKIVLIAFKIN